MDQLPDLKLIAVAATGMNNVDLDVAAELGIGVKNVAGYSTSSVAESTMTFALSLLKNAEYFDNTDYHVNATGRKMHTENLVEDIKKANIGIK